MWWLAAVAMAHVPNIASYTLTQAHDGWLLDASLPTDGMHSALVALHPEASLSDVTVEDYERVLVAALHDSISMAYDGQIVPLTQPVVSLAHHETHVRFRVPEPPADTVVISASINAFSVLGNQHNVFRVRVPERHDRVVLRASNGFWGAVRYAPFATSPWYSWETWRRL